ncbi:MAG TPA: hypothetical protein ENO22_08985 [candidate division Zixibacteria bacterium]|nr:hypothetical protein [candidate division Zixibacteria bacterium]
MKDFEKDFEKYLNLYLDGRLDHKDAGEFEKFLAENPEKAGELEAYKNLDHTAKSESLPELPEGYWEGLESRINKRVQQIPEYKSSWVGFKEKYFSFNKFMKIAASATVIVMAFLVSWHLIRGFRVLDTAGDEVLGMQRSPAVLDLGEEPPSADTERRYRGPVDSAIALKPETVTVSAEELELSGAVEDEVGDLAKTDETPPPPSQLSEKEAGTDEITFEQKKEKAMKAIPREQADKQSRQDITLAQPEGEIVSPEIAVPVMPDSLSIEIPRPDSEFKQSTLYQNYADDVIPAEDTAVPREGEERLDIFEAEMGVLRSDLAEKELELDDFPYLAMDEYSFTKPVLSGYMDAAPGKAAMPAPVLVQSELQQLRTEGDSLIEAYNVESNPDIKAALFNEIIDKSLEIVKISKAEEDMNRAELIIKRAMESRLIGFPQYKAYNDSLRLYMREK